MGGGGLPKIKIDGGTFKNVVKNFTPYGTLAGTAKTIGLTKNNYIDEAFKALGPKKKADEQAAQIKAKNDMAGISAAYSREALEARRKNLADNNAFTAQLQNQAAGKGPSLATAQLKMAQNRNLAQTLATAQNAGSSPLATRQLLANRGTASRDLAELGGVQRMQEQSQAQAMLGGQLGQAGSNARADIGQGFDISRAPVDWDDKQKDRAATIQIAREKIQAERDNAADSNRMQMWNGLAQGGLKVATGGMTSSDERLKQPPGTAHAQKEAAMKKSSEGAGAQEPEKPKKSMAQKFLEGVAASQEAEKKEPATQTTARMLAESFGGMFQKSDEQSKRSVAGDSHNNGKLPNAKAEVSDFLDKLQAKKYEYKNPDMPGAAPGERVGIIAQDLERSSMGKALVHNTAQGKMVDTVQGFGAVLAAQSELNKRLKALEGKKKA